MPAEVPAEISYTKCLQFNLPYEKSLLHATSEKHEPSKVYARIADRWMELILPKGFELRVPFFKVVDTHRNRTRINITAFFVSIS